MNLHGKRLVWYSKASNKVDLVKLKALSGHDTIPARVLPNKSKSNLNNK